jgi:streptogramin lyase
VSPYGVAVDSSGNIYVADSFNDRIQKFDSVGNFITKWGSGGEEEGQFFGAYGVAVDSSGNVYVADTGNDRIQKFSPTDVLADLTGQWTSLVQTCGDTRNGKKCRISGTLNIQNIGILKAPSSFVRFYLSDNGQYDEGADTFVKQKATGMIKAGKSKTGAFRCEFSVGETALGKFIIAVMDADNTVSESNESNNFVVFGPIP